ncbi:sigma 54-interacting transcriptional regulator [Desulfatibacillum aliphaticivorans]|uniref:sigma 54-interacting transcriptional regulator n=1 Tax=Desulfatibacillum aliphaticivorans TaxID=218208 RepID=UPI00040E670E|nr:sigma 54-interacting transcriptional regulator [Desulfatibacillum aliphaticivorans]
MLAQDLRPEEIFRRDRASGFPLFGSQRLLITGVPTLQRFGNDLRTIMGQRTSATVMTRLGYDTGLAAAMALADMYEFDSPEEWLKSFKVLLPATGMAVERDSQIHFDPENKTLRYTGIWEKSFEAQVWSMFTEGISDKPVCHVLSGIVSGFFTAILGKDVLVHELSCKAQGHDYCTFEARPMEEWGEDPLKIHEPLDEDWLNDEIHRLQKELKQSRQVLEKRDQELQRLKTGPEKNRHGIVFRSPEMGKIVELAEIAAPSNSTVLVQGESGTGKELVARFIHKASQRGDEPFVAINCAAIPHTLIESELFGHLKGSFTDARADKKGLLVEAGQGTIFMDEVGELGMEVQAKLLRALQQREVRPLGGLKTVPIQARIIAAANQDLREMVDQGAFRQDLFYRLSVFPLLIPPLRQRREDILILARHFLSRLDPSHPGFTPEVVRRMQAYHWPGNIRELENCVEYAYILSRQEPIHMRHLPISMAEKPRDIFDELAGDFPTPKELVRRYAQHVLQHTEGNKTQAARLMGVSPVTLWRYLNQGAET